MPGDDTESLQKSNFGQRYFVIPPVGQNDFANVAAANPGLVKPVIHGLHWIVCLRHRHIFSVRSAVMLSYPVTQEVDKAPRSTIHVMASHFALPAHANSPSLVCQNRSLGTLSLPRTA